LSALIRVLDNVQADENELCIWAVRALLRIGSEDAAESVPALIRMMDARDGVPGDRCGAEHDGSMEELGEAAGPSAVEALSGKHSKAALEMLRYIGPAALPAAIAKLSDPSRARDLGIYLESLGRAAAPAIPSWIATFESGNVTRAQFQEVVESIGAGADASTRAAIEAALRKPMR